MCKYCGNPRCHQGERCAKRERLVKRYRENDTSASSVLGRPGEWEHPIPKAAIKKIKYPLNLELNERTMYDNGIVIAMDTGAHRGGQSGAGGGVTSTGNSEIARNWSNRIARDINNFEGDRAISSLIRDEVHSINIFRSAERGMGNEISGIPYIKSLGAVLHDYAGKHIISPECSSENYRWICKELEGKPRW